jgi:hypothetical protein
MRISLLLTIPAVFLIASCYAQNETEFTVTLSKERVKVGQTFEYQISIDIEYQKYPKITRPEFSDFDIITQTTAQNFTYKEDATLFRFEITYVLLALKEGEFQLPGVSIEYKGTTVKSETKNIEVLGVDPEFEKRRKMELEQFQDEAISL